MTQKSIEETTKSFSSTFIFRPVATILLMCSIVISGLLGYFYLPVAPLPQVDYPTIQVTTYYPGASPDIMTTAVTAPLERQLGQVSGLDQMYSQNGQGVSVITLQFNLNLSMDVAEQEVQAAINAARQLLPDDLPYPPIYNKVNPADSPILTIAITSDVLPMTQVADLVQNRIVHQLSQVGGIGLVTQSGGQKPAIRVNFNSQAITQYRLDSETIRNAIARASVNSAKGSFDGPLQSISITANDQLMSVEEYKNIIITRNNETESVLRLGDIAEVTEAAENLYVGAWSKGVPAIILNIQRQPGANVIKAVDEIKLLLPSLTESLPASVDVEILTDRTSSIRASIFDVQLELLFAISLVILVIYFFLRNLRATLIASIAVPLSIIGTFAIIHLLGFSINNLTLMALTIATGFVVDDAIVVIENITRYIESKKGDSELKLALGEKLEEEDGLSSLEASLVGAKEIGFTIISLTISLVAVLIPLLFMGDIIGRLFFEFAVTLAVAILISGVVSLTLTPMLCAKLLKKDPHHLSAMSTTIETFFNRVIIGYSKTLKVALRHPKRMLLLTIATFLCTVGLYIMIPKGFFPIQDNSLIQATVIASPSSSYQKMSEIQDEVSNRLAVLTDIEDIAGFVGIDNTNITLNTLQLQIGLVPLEERSSTIDEIMQQIQQEIRKIPDVEVYLQLQQDLTIDTQKSRTPYRFTIQATSIEQFNEWVPKITDSLEALSSIKDLNHDWQNGGKEIYLQINRDIASRMGVTVKAINDALYNAFGQRQVSTLYTQSNQYRIVIESRGNDDNDSLALQSLAAVYVKNDQGDMISLDVLAHMVEKSSVLSLNRLAQFPVITFYFNVNEAKGVALDEAVSSIKASLDKVGLPPDMRVEFQGATLAFSAALTNTIFLIIAAVITMYIVLGILYESFIHPVTILSTLPSAAIGALIALMSLGKSFDMIAVIGIILLIGIVKKNAIMMIDFALVAQREHGLSPSDAIVQACLLRFRPILMTTMAAILGAVPLMLSQGVGAELRQPLGITLVGGLLLSQLLTLYTTPIIYLYFDKWSSKSREETKSLSSLYANISKSED
ncbi:efflux RND transporter permease subunit [Thorsellia kenyensis]|uniref:Efflux RND transporter permease subunit n=1 Tax=Thorsellia kenyensis TaxID=1549888 RepID=A0ABV6CCU7_9GAMM